jgi:hypothetical protein
MCRSNRTERESNQGQSQRSSEDSHRAVSSRKALLKSDGTCAGAAATARRRASSAPSTSPMRSCGARGRVQSRGVHRRGKRGRVQSWELEWQGRGNNCADQGTYLEAGCTLHIGHAQLATNARTKPPQRAKNHAHYLESDRIFIPSAGLLRGGHKKIDSGTRVSYSIKWTLSDSDRTRIISSHLYSLRTANPRRQPHPRGHSMIYSTTISLI